MTDAQQQIAELQAELAATKAALAAGVNLETERAGGRGPSLPGTSSLSAQPRVDSYRAPKLPQFYRNDPVVWFAQVEASFRNARITSQATKADIVIAGLDPEAATAITDLILSPDATAPYDCIKERIISAFSVSAEAKLRQILKGQIAYDGKPSQLLARMRHESGGACSEPVLKSIFFEYLPEQCRNILAASSTPDLQDLAKLADAIVESMSLNQRGIASTESRATYSNSELQSRVEQLSRDLSKLTVMVNKSLNARSANRSRARNRSSSSQRDESAGAADRAATCWWHRRYGSKARKCSKPCSWVEQRGN